MALWLTSSPLPCSLVTWLFLLLHGLSCLFRCGLSRLSVPEVVGDSEVCLFFWADGGACRPLDGLRHMISTGGRSQRWREGVEVWNVRVCAGNGHMQGTVTASGGGEGEPSRGRQCSAVDRNVDLVGARSPSSMSKRITKPSMATNVFGNGVCALSLQWPRSKWAVDGTADELFFVLIH
ncbi:hypothetical protein BC826DRAFT_111417 [Russula brevipes]|nr:hypothetical protein BC826DRAFT_111417 [Russula brevipes]